MKKIFYASVAILIFNFQCSICSAQTWQWAKRGGTNVGSTSTNQDRLNGIVFDKNGNSYILSNIYTDKVSGTIDIDGIKLGNGNGHKDLCLISFDCSGKFRWSKIIGGKSIDNAYAICSDTIDGIYIAGQVLARNKGDSIFFDKDTSFGTTLASAKPIYKSLFIAKYDTLGKYKWSRFPEPDTLSTFNNSASFSICSSPKGDVSVLLYAGSTGAFANGSYNIPTSAAIPSIHMLKYDTNGGFIKGFALDITEGDGLTLADLRMGWDLKNDFYYLLSLNRGGTGVNYPKFGTTKMTGTNCLSKFSNTGANIWVKQTTSAWYTGVLSSEPKIDSDGNIYIGTSEGPGGNFNGYVATNTLAGGNSVPVVIKLNPSGTNIWGYSGSSSVYAKGSCVSVSKSGEVGFAGYWVGQLKFGTKTANSLKSDLFLLKLDATTGVLKSFDTVKSGDESIASSLTSDGKGNFYLGGDFRSNLNFQSAGILSNYGGQTDFFIAKFGVADCKEPVSINENDLQKSIVKIYPNPTQDIITFEALQSDSEVRLFNIMGQQVHSFKAKNNKEQVSISHLASGMYLVQIRNVDGEIYTAKIVKE
jgi:hypothetical protein